MHLSKPRMLYLPTVQLLWRRSEFTYLGRWRSRIAATSSAPTPWKCMTRREPGGVGSAARGNIHPVPLQNAVMASGLGFIESFTHPVVLVDHAAKNRAALH